MTALEPLASDLYPTADANGTISWWEAVRFVHHDDPDLNFVPQFSQDYGHMFGARIDLGELETWRCDLVGRVIANIVFSEA